MTNEELCAAMREDRADREFLEELHEGLQAELQKPIAEQDHDRINDLMETITELTGQETLVQERAQAGIARMQQYSEQIRTPRKMIRVQWLIPITAAVVLLTVNVLSYSVFGMNAFSAAVQITNGGIMIGYNAKDQDSEADMNQYMEEMLAICEENGFTPLVPHYIPAELSPTDVWVEAIDLGSTKDVFFEFSYKKRKLNINYTYLTDPSIDLNYGMPAQSYHPSVEIICGVDIYFLQKSETEFTISFIKEQIFYSLYSEGFEETEVRKILYSMFE